MCIRVNSWFENASATNREWTLVYTNWKEPIRVHARLFVVEDTGSVIDHEWTLMDADKGDLIRVHSRQFVV